ncbi:hypothetical protein [Chthoniobacter flavus]|uniref:hypothetical protein n=1 Tax=Chthoniobacter flavus TaxID=191863 RepID=UPI0002E8A9F0|nr:hypothetical protein [Chthoniobacter flavus]
MISVAGGIAILAFATTGKITAVSPVLWIASPLVLLWLLDIGLASGQRHCAELLKKNPAKEDASVLLWEGGDASLGRFCRELISLSIWPFYLILFALIYFGGKEITKTNQEAAAQAEKKAATATAAMSPYSPQSSMPFGQARQPNNGPMPFNRTNPALPRFTPAPFPTPPRFTMPSRPPATPVRFATPPPAPNNSPAPAVKNP